MCGNGQKGVNKLNEVLFRYNEVGVPKASLVTSMKSCLYFYLLVAIYTLNKIYFAICDIFVVQKSKSCPVFFKSLFLIDFLFFVFFFLIRFRSEKKLESPVLVRQ